MADFGTQFAHQMAFARYQDGAWSDLSMRAVEPLPMHPATHCLHYASECFEGLKAYRGPGGDPHLFRPDRHVARLRNSARLLMLPEPSAELIMQSLVDTVAAARDLIPEYPGALYLRPVLIGVDANIGAAAKPVTSAIYYVLASPVGDYFKGGMKPLNVLVVDDMRTTPSFGQVKTGGNYAAALRRVQQARIEHGADQVLFCPGGNVQETAAANFILIDGDELLTKPADGSILPGITRASLLQLATDLGLTVSERDFSIEELLRRAPTAEAALSGTAAVLTPVGNLLWQGETHRVGNGEAGPHTLRLREALGAIQSGAGADPHGWRVAV